ncbi:ferredoxin reductase family protein [Alisedimentitalea sp. MJ-SS2]|uniref:ferredoxin reductase family protein n=1 Tax=Aliisedimentitalea sp. MJ-SS2 TaxID=3049795 RepID=UPI0029077F79|nr:ferredoxin reductase family protein [Alisedimentitalea sp. MJ-SS2]MDU8927508.1 ferredoxin reductase family protein [Alisedimentitalea sp. MJ-SS2]
MNPRLLIALYLFVILLPLGLSALGTRPPRALSDELASGAGMLAYAILLAEFLLSGRFRAISGRIGIDITMRFHQLLARTAIVLALVHPLAYTNPSMGIDLSAIGAGAAAWGLLFMLFLAALSRDRPGTAHETWRLFHGLGAALIAALLLYHTLYAGRYAQDPVLAAVWIGLFAVALASLLFVYLLKPLHKMRHPWTAESIRKIATRTWEVTLTPQRHDGMRYKAGQFAWISIGRSAISLNENPFSIASAPASGNKLQFVIKELGDFTRTLGRIQPGTRAYVDGPHGNMMIDNHGVATGIAMVAGGVGIAPILGILRQLHLENDPRPTTLLYGNRREDQIVYRDELDNLARDHGTRVVHALYEPPEGWDGHHGMCDAALIRQEFDQPEMRHWLYVLCGPPVMMDIAEETLIEMGVPAGNIISERFKYD